MRLGDECLRLLLAELRHRHLQAHGKAEAPAGRATLRIALAKHAAYPAANSCSGLVPSPPGPPMASGMLRSRSSLPSSVRVWPLRPRSVAVAVAV